ncbi:MAG TPA: TrkA C-terminal domain-containing protein [Acidimicrobiia bacterium]|nr:TrkA C-terminal domain-containing protein [Acidimicrobiia bacterium]
MADVAETQLPGMGVRYDFTTEAGEHVGVLVHRTGRRDVFLYSADDPDECRATITLRPDDARTLAELLGATRVAEHLAAVQQQVAGLTLEWILVSPTSPWAGLTLREAAIHTETGVSVVALLDGDSVTAAPGAEDVLVPGAQVVAIGTPEGLKALNARLSGR